MRNIILKYILKIIGKDIFKEYEKIKKLEYNSIDKNLKIQEKKLKKLLLYAYKNVPYYTKVLKETKVIENEKVNLENFIQIPILTKDIIRKEGENLYSKEKRKGIYENRSGGSTGEPIGFLQDNDTWYKHMATKWFYYSFITDTIPCKIIKLWGSERDVLKGGYGIKGNIKNWLYSRKILNSFKMSEKDMIKYTQEINNYRPEIIEAYVQSIYELTNFIEKNDIKIYSPKGIITSAGTLYPEIQKKIEKVFQCKVYNRYGSREVGDIANSCEKNEGLHLSIWQNYVEILNDNLQKCKQGEIEKIYITNLNNYTMPLIRYDIGDVGVLSKNNLCSCKRGLPLIQEIKGRDNCLFKTKDGRKIDGIFFYIYKSVIWVKKYQIIQKDYNLIEIKLVKNKKPKQEYIDITEKRFKKIMGKDCKIIWKFVKDIKPLYNGKFIYIKSEIK